MSEPLQRPEPATEGTILTTHARGRLSPGAVVPVTRLTLSLDRETDEVSAEVSEDVFVMPMIGEAP